MSLWGLVWRNIFSRLIKHLFYHLIIPLTGGILVEAAVHQAVHLLVAEDNVVVRTFLFRILILIVGVGISWLLVMFLLIAHETKKKVDLSNLMSLEKVLKESTGYYGVSTISLADWFNPGRQLYLAKLMKRKLEVDYFEHDRTLLFFSNWELKNTTVDLMDEHHDGESLAVMHRDFGIPLSFLKRKEIFEILKSELNEAERLKLGCYPRWTNWRPFKSFQRVRLNWLRRRIPQLDFALVTRSNGERSVLPIRRSEGQLRIEEELSPEEAKPYIKFADIIHGRVYEEDGKLKKPYDFLRRFGHEAQSRQRTERDAHQVRIEQLAEQHNAKFRIKRYTRFVDIAEKSGDVSVREEFEGVTAFPDGARRERMARQFRSQSGHFGEPRITDVDEAQIGWEWAGESTWEWEEESTKPGTRRGFFSRKGSITFYPPVENNPVRFVFHRSTDNAMHFNQRDRQGPTEEVYGYIENLHDLYVLKVRFPKDSFPERFQIHVEPPQDQCDAEEEKPAFSCFVRFTSDSTAVLVLDRPLPGYTYKIRWELPKDDIEERNLSRRQTQILREANKRLLTLGSDAERLENVLRHLNELQTQIANETLGAYAINDAGIEVSIHAYDDEDKQALVRVASTSNGSENVVPPGRSTVGQAYKRRDLVSWLFAPDSNDRDFWDYGSGHLGIVSIPLFFPLQTKVGGRVAVLSIATNFERSGFLDVIDQLDEPTTRAFTQLVNAWYAKHLANAIGLPDLSTSSLLESD